MKLRVFSGIRATGRLHLGNYLGAVKGMLALQDKYDCIFSVVDLHTITTPYNVADLQKNINEVVLDYLGAGLDLKKCHLMIQSDLKEYHLELSYYFATIYPVSRLQQLPTYKEKVAQYPQDVNLALLYYPVLMAADVLLYKGSLVPVGIDQEPHLEVMREIGRKFNRLYGTNFPMVKRFKTIGESVPSLLGQGKMSKTVAGSFINLTDDLKTIRKHLAKAPTDSGKRGGLVPKEGGVANLFVFLKLFCDAATVDKFTREYKQKKIRYVELKEVLAKAIYQELQPIQEKRKYYQGRLKMVAKILKQGQEYCRRLARETLVEVREKMGVDR